VIAYVEVAFLEVAYLKPQAHQMVELDSKELTYQEGNRSQVAYLHQELDSLC
jgi:hypothetical protein